MCKECKYESYLVSSSSSRKKETSVGTYLKDLHSSSQIRILRKHLVFFVLDKCHHRPNNHMLHGKHFGDWCIR
ncbi:hypothetical protein ACOSQ3_001688 [Xanthoceras sorbifolium]